MIPKYSSKRVNEKKPMPVWARIVAAGLGMVLLPLGITAFVVIRPLDLKGILIGSGAAGVGLDLLGGAYSGKWPLSLQWMPLP